MQNWTPDLQKKGSACGGLGSKDPWPEHFRGARSGASANGSGVASRELGPLSQ